MPHLQSGQQDGQGRLAVTDARFARRHGRLTALQLCESFLQQCLWHEAQLLSGRLQATRCSTLHSDRVSANSTCERALASCNLHTVLHMLTTDKTLRNQRALRDVTGGSARFPSENIAARHHRTHLNCHHLLLPTRKLHLRLLKRQAHALRTVEHTPHLTVCLVLQSMVAPARIMAKVW